MKISKKTWVLMGEGLVAGVAMGPVFLYGSRKPIFTRTWIHEGEVQKEIKRFYWALDEARSQLNQIKSKLCKIQGRDQITILDSHMLLLKDDLLVRNTVNAITQEHVNTEWALDKTMGEIKEAFSKMNQAYFRDREYDIDYIENAILQNLMGCPQDFLKRVPKGSIIVAPDLSPAEVLHLIRYRVAGFVLERGSTNTHTSIVLRAMGIPSLFRVENLIDRVFEGDFLILNGHEGRLVINPRALEIERCEKQRKNEISQGRLIKKEAQEEAKTMDDHPVVVLGNMELVDELDLLEEYGTQGIGLYRTEFLFMNRKTPPTLDEQVRVYREVLHHFAPLEVTIRTLDVGADKLGPYDAYSVNQPNPALGLRGIRFCLKEKKIFTDQLEALILASGAGQLKICIPMVSSADEFIKVKKLFNEIYEDIKNKDKNISKNISLGAMIEVPSAVYEMDLLAKEADFFSLGTNDLIQYLLAVDRTNELVSDMFKPTAISVIRVLSYIVLMAKKHEKEVTVCGEMAGDPIYLWLLLGLGYKRLSMNAASIPKIKKLIRMTSLESARQMVEKIMGSHSSKEIQKILQSKMKENFPQYFQ